LVSVAPQTAKVTGFVRDEVLMKVKKSLKFLGGKHDFYCSVIP
jgi:hypothetical protein